MSELPISVDKDKCISCSLCATACPFAAIEMEKGYPVFLDECHLCGACVEACLKAVIAIKEAEKEADVFEYKGVLVYAEQRNGVVHPVAFELLGKGRELADQLGEDPYAVAIGKDVDKGAEELAVRGADKVFVYSDPALEDFRDDSYSALLEGLVRDENYKVLLKLAREGRIKPSAGAGIGVERLICWIAGAGHIGEIQPFPRIPSILYEL